MKNWIAPLLGVIILYTACRKPVEPEMSNPCPEAPTGSVGISWFTESRFQYQKAHFNPNNSNEFVYFYKDNLLNENKLMTYNLLSEVKTEILDDVIVLSQPKWSRKGWVAFDDLNNYHIWKIKENGDSLIQITENAANLYPVWDAIGDNLHWLYSQNLAIPHYFLKQGLNNSSPPDTLLRDGDEHWGYAAYNNTSSNNKLLSITGIDNIKHLAYANLNDSPLSFTSVLGLQQENLIGLRNFCWSNNSELAYFTFYNGDIERAGIYVLDVLNGSYVKLIASCSSSLYKTITCSPDGLFLICEKVDETLSLTEEGEYTGEIVQSSTLSLINLQTLEETTINLN